MQLTLRFSRAKTRRAAAFFAGLDRAIKEGGRKSEKEEKYCLLPNSRLFFGHTKNLSRSEYSGVTCNSLRDDHF